MDSYGSYVFSYVFTIATVFSKLRLASRNHPKSNMTTLTITNSLHTQHAHPRITGHKVFHRLVVWIERLLRGGLDQAHDYRHKFVGLKLLGYACILSFWSMAAHAQTLFNIDLKCSNPPQGSEGVQQTGSAVIGLRSNDLWNDLYFSRNTSSNSLAGLQTSAGATTGVSVSATCNDFGFSNSGGTAMDSSTFPLMQDYIAQLGTGAFTMLLSGLGAYTGDTFTLVIYAAGDTSGQGSSLTLAGATGGNSGSTLMTSGTSRQISSGAGVAYQTFTGTLTGTTLSVSGNVISPSNYAILNGAQLEFYSNAVPEPSTWAAVLGGTGLLGWTLRRRRA